MRDLRGGSPFSHDGGPLRDAVEYFKEVGAPGRVGIDGSDAVVGIKYEIAQVVKPNPAALACL